MTSKEATQNALGLQWIVLKVLEKTIAPNPPSSEMLVETFLSEFVFPLNQKNVLPDTATERNINRCISLSRSMTRFTASLQAGP